MGIETDEARRAVPNDFGGVVAVKVGEGDSADGRADVVVDRGWETGDGRTSLQEVEGSWLVVRPDLKNGRDLRGAVEAQIGDGDVMT
jgi:hypothetical protein